MQLEIQVFVPLTSPSHNWKALEITGGVGYADLDPSMSDIDDADEKPHKASVGVLQMQSYWPGLKAV